MAGGLELLQTLKGIGDSDLRKITNACILRGVLSGKQLRKESQLPVGLIAQFVEPYTSIAEVMGSNPFQAWIFCKLCFRNCVSCVNKYEGLFLYLICHPQFKCMFHIFTFHLFILHGFITNSPYDQLPVGLIAQLVEHYTGITEVMGSNPTQPECFQAFCSKCVSCMNNCKDIDLSSILFNDSFTFKLNFLYISSKTLQSLWRPFLVSTAPKNDIFHLVHGPGTKCIPLDKEKGANLTLWVQISHPCTLPR